MLVVISFINLNRSDQFLPLLPFLFALLDLFSIFRLNCLRFGLSGLFSISGFLIFGGVLCEICCITSDICPLSIQLQNLNRPGLKMSKHKIMGLSLLSQTRLKTNLKLKAE